MHEYIATLEPARVATAMRKVKSQGIDRKGSILTNRIATKVYCTSFESRIGKIYVASSDRGVCKISVPKETHKDFFNWLNDHFNTDAVVDNRSKNKDIIDQLNRYFNGKLVKFTSPVDLIGTEFQLRVWKELTKISYGSTATYKQIAKRLSMPGATQAIGKANCANPLPIIIPCHRVLGAKGSLVGYSCGIKTKEFLLRLEGAIIL
ncbi:MAG: methylated-DNA--[protein]-cysteine S-methyltransferase [Bacteroidota bacterium]